MFQLIRQRIGTLRHSSTVGNAFRSCVNGGGSNFSCKCGSCISPIKVGRAAYSTEGVKDETSASSTTADEKDGKIAQLQDSYLRCLAEMENLRQRTRREVESASSFAIQKFCSDIVGVADVLELAVGSVKGDPKTAHLLRGDEEAMETADTPSDTTTSIPMALNSSELTKRFKDLAVGLSMTFHELIKVFAKHGVTTIDPLHQKFDPNHHMALYEVPNADLDSGTVVAVQKKGYLLNHRVIRPASVGVSKKP